MFRQIILAAALLATPSVAAAQSTTGNAAAAPAATARTLTGTWVRDGSRSDVVPDSMYWTVRGVVTGGTRGPNSNVTLQIERTADTLRITDPARPLRVYRLDGRPHTVPADTGLVEATITSKVEGDAVVVERSQNYAGLPGSVTLNTLEHWTLGPDGNTLVLTTARTTPARRVTYTEVYKRQ